MKERDEWECQEEKRELSYFDSCGIKKSVTYHSKDVDISSLINFIFFEIQLTYLFL